MDGPFPGPINDTTVVEPNLWVQCVIVLLQSVAWRTNAHALQPLLTYKHLQVNEPLGQAQ